MFDYRSEAYGRVAAREFDRSVRNAERNIRPATVPKWPARVVSECDDLPDQDHVVAGIDSCVKAAIKPGGDTFNHGRAGRLAPPAYFREPVRCATCEED
jgi:hypothetical protein